MGFFGKLVKAVVNVAEIPVAMAKDVFDTWWHGYESKPHGNGTKLHAGADRKTKRGSGRLGS
jgi:hypothetical protein